MNKINVEIIQAALSEYGVTEKPGDKHEGRILEYFAEIGHPWIVTGKH